MDILLDKYRTAVEGAADLILVSDGFRDMDGLEAARIRIINRGLLAGLGLSAEEVRAWEGRPLDGFFGRYVEDRDALAGYFERLRAAYVVEDAAFRLVNGERTLRVSGHSEVVLCPTEGYYFLGAFQDVTPQRRLEAELRKEQAERAEWDTFIRHELRGKLGPVVGFSELLIANFDRFPAEKVREFLTAIFESGHRLNEVLDLTREFHAYARGEIGMAWTEGDLCETVRNAATEAALAVRAREADHPASWTLVASGDPLPLLHDPLKMQRALRNLIQNAHEHSREAVTLRVEEAEGGVRVCVRNGGEPVDAGRLGRIFEKFNSTKSGGMGLGTTLARLIVEAHGGRVSATSSEEEGTTFTVWLPKKGL